MRLLCCSSTCSYINRQCSIIALRCVLHFFWLILWLIIFDQLWHVIDDQAHHLLDLEHDVAHLQQLHNKQEEHIIALTCTSDWTQVMVDAQSFKHDALCREMNSWMELMDKNTCVLSHTCLGLSGHLVSYCLRWYSSYLQAIMVDCSCPAMDSNEEDWGSASSSSSSSLQSLLCQSHESCLRVLDDPMDSNEGVSGASVLVMAGT